MNLDTAKTKKRGRPKKAPPRDPHCERAIAYARDVCSGKVIASKVTVGCCERFLRDLDRQADPSWPYVFDEELAGRACQFLEDLPHVEGPLAGEPLKLGDWQCFVQANIWGWVRRSDRCRRFLRVEIWVPRGNGKSFFASGNCTFAVAACGEPGAQVVAAATTRDQAKTVLDVSRRQLESTPELMEYLGLEVSKHAIIQPSTFSRYRAVSSEAKTADGKNLFFCCCDELHAHESRHLYDILLTGLGKRKEGTMFVISTAGDRTEGIGRERYNHAKQVALGLRVDEQTFCALWEADEGDVWDDERTWAKANPNLGQSVDIETLRSEAATARSIASARAVFFTRRLNWWVGAERAFVNMIHWDRCIDPNFSREALRAEGVPMWLGLDLATKKDVTALAYIWKRIVDDHPHYWIAVDCYLPQLAIDEAQNSSYRGWVLDGLLKPHAGEQINYRDILKIIREAEEGYALQELCYDNLQPAEAIAQDARTFMGDDRVVQIRGTYTHMNAPMRELEAGLASGRIHLERNDMLRWMASNLIGVFRGDEVRPDKEHEENKIDGMSAILMALNRAEIAEAGPYLDGGGLLSL